MRILILGRLSVERWGMEMMLKILYWWRWRATLVESNEDPKLELLRTYEPLDRT